ncbi:hypothetical protein FRC11_012760, partial [Ceratobasidium sp. 423]
DATSPELNTTVPGILIEYIPCTNLSKIDPSAANLDGVCTAAVHIVGTYSDLNVLNRDVRLENFIIKPNGSEIVVIDFGYCCSRKEEKGNQARKEAKWSEDKEGAVGYIAKRKYRWNFVPIASRRYILYVNELAANNPT